MVAVATKSGPSADDLVRRTYAIGRLPLIPASIPATSAPLDRAADGVVRTAGLARGGLTVELGAI
jgi:hypothetical protein